MDSTSLNQIYRLLALCAHIERHPHFDEQLTSQLNEFTAWEELPAQAELHGLGPLLWYHLQKTGFTIPDTTRRILRGLYLRDRTLNQIHTQTLVEIVTLFEKKGISPLVLKGLALAYQLYPDPALRPISDHDLLFKPEDLLPALRALAEAGYRVDQLETSPERLPKELTADSPPRQGISTHIELHHYNPQNRTSLDNSPDDEFQDFQEPPQPLNLNGCTVYTPSPLDTLHYLLRHTLRHLFDARADRPLPLKWCADLLGLVEKYATEIDWAAIQQCDPAFLKRLEVLYSLTPLPERLESIIPIRKIRLTQGLNQYPGGWPQWPFPNWKKVGFWRYCWRTFTPPSEWWLRLYYGIDQPALLWYGQIVYRAQILRYLFWALRRKIVGWSKKRL